MARQRQGQNGPRSLWARAGERAGDGAGALFARLDAQDAQDALDALNAQGVGESQTPQALQDHRALQAAQAREQAAATLERLAARIRSGAWSDDIAALVARASRLSES